MLRIVPTANLDTFYDADIQRYLCADGVARGPVVSRADFKRYYAGCPSIGFECDGLPIGGVLWDGRRAHIAVLRAFHGRWAWLLKDATHWLFSLKREVIVAVEADNLRCQRFLQRAGWCLVGRQDDEVLYLLQPLGGSRKTPYPFARKAAGGADRFSFGSEPRRALAAPVSGWPHAQFGIA